MAKSSGISNEHSKNGNKSGSRRSNNPPIKSSNGSVGISLSSKGSLKNN